MTVRQMEVEYKLLLDQYLTQWYS